MIQEASLLAKVGIPVLSAALAFMVALYMRNSKRGDDERARLAIEVAGRVVQLAAMERQLAILNTQVAPMWAVALKRLTDDLHHPSKRFADGDKLLEDFMALRLTPERHKRFVEFLEERLRSDDPDVGEHERESAQVMLVIARRVAEEATNQKAIL